MRFLSPNPAYKFSAVKQQYELLASGQFREIAPGFMCEFKQDTTNWEREYARQHFTFRGVPHDMSGVRDVDPVPLRVSSFDTGTIENPDLRKRVEKRLLETQNLNDHILVERPAEPAPWPTYDSDKPATIAPRVKELGFDASKIITYEREHKNRPSVIEALEKLIEAEPEEELVVA